MEERSEGRVFPTCNIMGVEVAVTNLPDTVQALGQNLPRWRGGYVCAANVHTTVTAYRDQDYCRVQNGAVLALPDGGPLSKYSRSHGYPQAQRVTGPDLMRAMLQKSAGQGWRHYFYGSTRKTLDLMEQVIPQRYPGITVAGTFAPPFRKLTPEEDREAVEKINAAKPDFIWVGLGAPRQEQWMADHEGRVAGLMLGVGAAFDYEAGNIRRAPEWMQKANLEWLYRLMQDPRRLMGRYLTTNTSYLWWALRH